MKAPAHKILIDRFISWDLVKERLERYKNICKFYSLNDLQDCSKKAPYYCHYLGWRLGTWEDEQWFEFFDKLLDNAARLSNWNKARVPQGCEFENFWSFVWELQIAQFFSNNTKASVEWTNSGPDLKINSNRNQFFVECTIYRKSFGLEEFIGELLTHIHPEIMVHHIPFNIFSLPKDKNIEFFLDELCAQFLDVSFLDTKMREAQQVSPIILPAPKGVGNLYIVIENHNAMKFNHHQPWTTTGSPDDFLSDVIEKALKNKRDSNELKSHRPNLLAVNLLLGLDFQLATALRSIPTPRLGTEFDAVFLTACGIDKIPSLNNGLIHFYDNHPIKDFLNQ